jgi:hypothetical protein
MNVLLKLSQIAVHQVLGERGAPLAAFLDDRFGDHAGRMGEALFRANDRAWRSLELAVGGESLWQSITGMLAAAEEKALERQVRAFLTSLPAAKLPGDPAAFRRDVHGEIQAARRVKLIPGERLTRDDRSALASDLSKQADAERAALTGVAGHLRREGFERLAAYVELRPASGQPLLASAVRYFFRREVENDPKLAAGLTVDRLDGMAAAQRDGFEQLHRALTDHGGRLEGLLEESLELARATRADTAATRQGVDALLAKVEAMARMIETLTAAQRPAAQIEKATAQFAEAAKEYETACRTSGIPVYPTGRIGLAALLAGAPKEEPKAATSSGIPVRPLGRTLDLPGLAARPKDRK